LRLVAHRQRRRPRLCGGRSIAFDDRKQGTPPNFELHGGGLLRPQSSILALRGAKATVAA